MELTSGGVSSYFSFSVHGPGKCVDERQFGGGAAPFRIVSRLSEWENNVYT